MSKLSIGIIGYRGFGTFCADVFQKSSVGSVLAFAGRDAEAMKETAEKLGVPRTYTDWKQLVLDPDIDIVHIVTPPNLHAEMAIFALEAGKHVLVEKPLATTRVDGEGVLAAAQKAGKLVGINYVMRYNPLYNKVAKIAASGAVGRLTHVEFQNYASDEKLGDNHWFWDPEQSGGIFIEHGVHFFDIVGLIANTSPIEVTAQTWKRADGKEDRVQALVTYKNEVEASFYHAFNRPGALERQIIHFAFEKAHLSLEGWNPNLLSLQALVSEEDLTMLRSILPSLVVSAEGFGQSGSVMHGAGQSYHVEHKISAQEMLADLTSVYQKEVTDVLIDLAAAITNPSHMRQVTGQDGLDSLMVAMAARDAARQGSPIVL